MLQSSTTELVSQKVEMTTLQRRVRVFAGKNKEVHMTKFAEDVTQILDDIGDNLKVCVSICRLLKYNLAPFLIDWRLKTNELLFINKWQN